MRKPSPWGPVQPPIVDCLALAWFHTLSAPQAKPKCLLDGFALWVAPSLLTVDHCTSVWSYCLVRVLGDMTCYLPR
jgi:hypothetical protein